MSQEEAVSFKQQVLKFGKGIFVCFLLFHSCGTIANNYPKNTAFQGDLQKPFEFYVRPLHLHKPYDMFYTYDPWYKFDLEITGVDNAGQSHKFAPILPGLEAIEGKGKLRVRVTLQRMLGRRNWDLLESYAQNLCRAIYEQSGKPMHEVTITFKTERLRKLGQIRKDGVISKPRDLVKGPFQCNAL